MHSLQSRLPFTLVLYLVSSSFLTIQTENSKSSTTERLVSSNPRA